MNDEPVNDKQHQQRSIENDFIGKSNTEILFQVANYIVHLLIPIQLHNIRFSAIFFPSLWTCGGPPRGPTKVKVVWKEVALLAPFAKF